MASITGRFLFLIQLISFQGPLALFNISWIFWSKNNCLVYLTVFLKSAKLLVNLYFSKSLLQLISHQLFKCLEILIILKFLFQALSMVLANKMMTFSRDLVLDSLEVLMNEMSLIKSLMNDFSSLLSLTIECLQLLMCCFLIEIVTVREAWSDNNLHSRWIVWLSSLTDPYLRNMRSMTKFKL